MELSMLSLRGGKHIQRYYISTDLMFYCTAHTIVDLYTYCVSTCSTNLYTYCCI
jgi:hypothetical protein